MDRVRLGEAHVHQAVLDHAGGHAQQHENVLLRLGGTAADVKHGRHAALGVVDRHRGTGQAGVLAQEVVGLLHHHRLRLGHAGAHAVGAGLLLAPDRPDLEAERLRHALELLRADHVQDDALRVGEHDRGLRIAHLLVQRGHLVARAVDDVGHAAAAHRHLVAAEHRRTPALARVQAVFVDAARPRLDDSIAGQAARAPLDDLDDAVRMLERIDDRHGLSPLVRLAAAWRRLANLRAL